MGIIEFYVDIYVGKSLTDRKRFVLPIMMAILQSVDMCQQLSNEKNPIKAIFYCEGDSLEYKNKAYEKFESGE